jgi:hypothetical protein
MQTFQGFAGEKGEVRGGDTEIIAVEARGKLLSTEGFREMETCKRSADKRDQPFPAREFHQ